MENQAGMSNECFVKWVCSEILIYDFSS